MVLTCAHNCYDRKLRKESKNMIFIPGNNRDQEIALKVKNIYYPP